MYQFLLVGIGGFLGAISRFSVTLIARSYISHPFPIPTLFINVSGCFAIGVLFEYLKGHHLLPTVTLFAATGFLGSFTTFSAFGFETIELIRNNEFHMALWNICGNLILCLCAVLLGGWVGSYLRA